MYKRQLQIRHSHDAVLSFPALRLPLRGNGLCILLRLGAGTLFGLCSGLFRLLTQFCCLLLCLLQNALRNFFCACHLFHTFTHTAIQINTLANNANTAYVSTSVAIVIALSLIHI